MIIKIIPNEHGNPAGKLADVELHFNAGDFAGLKLVGFAIWQRRSGNGRNVTFPARVYSVNGERRSFALLRPIADMDGQDRVRDLILHAYTHVLEVAAPLDAEFEHQATAPSPQDDDARMAAASRTTTTPQTDPTF